MESLLIIVLTVLPLVLQLMAISVFSERMARALRRAADQPPFTTAVLIAELGPSPKPWHGCSIGRPGWTSTRSTL